MKTVLLALQTLAFACIAQADEALLGHIHPPPAPAPPRADDPFQAAVAKHCQRCHMLGQPDALSKDLWVNKVLPEMGCYLGVHHSIPQYQPFIEVGADAEEKAQFAKAGLYPPKPVMDIAEWDKIVGYFYRDAPAEVAVRQKSHFAAVSKDEFRPRFLGKITDQLPQITWLRIDPANGQIVVADHTDRSLKWYSREGKIVATHASVGTIVAETPHGDDMRLLDIGILEPSDKIAGRWLEIDGLEASANSRRVPSPALKRPVDFVQEDFDGDGVDEVVVAEYGNKTGRLSLYKLSKQGKWLRKVLNAKSGNRIVRLADMNADGKQDLVVLRAQESEDVLIYFGLGGFDFRESVALKNPAYWGSNDLEIVDFDGDGLLDLVLANGDNADTTQILKDFHSITFYRNVGQSRFEKVQTIPFHGAYAIRAIDADFDGDVDFAAFSAFPDFENDQASVLLMKQSPDGEFIPRSIPVSSESRWMVMDVADIDGDGDEDIALGAHLPGPSGIPEGFLKRAVERTGPILLIENLSR